MGEKQGKVFQSTGVFIKPGSSNNLKFRNIPLCRTFASSNFFGGPLRVRDSECENRKKG